MCIIRPTYNTTEPETSSEISTREIRTYGHKHSVPFTLRDELFSNVNREDEPSRPRSARKCFNLITT